MNLSQLEILVAIAETGSLTEAAEAVSLTQSAVSYSLRKLETELGVILLERGRQGIEMTRIGLEVLHHARNALTQIEIIRQKTARERGFSIGKLRVGCVPTIPARLITGILRDFQRQYPEIEVVLFEGTPRELVDWLENSVIDIGTVVTPDLYQRAIALARTEIKIIMSIHHAMASQTTIHVDQLASEILIGPKTEYGLIGQFPPLDRLGLPRIRHEVSTQQTILSMVRENMGIAMVPAMLIEPDMDGICAISLEPRLMFDVYLGTHLQSPAANAFLESASTWSRNHGFLTDQP